ncbi:MAG: hypothetical protein ACM31C_29990 [Acidobacteriota bacterium]
MTEHDLPQQPEDVPGRPVLVTLAATVLAIAACVVVVWALQSFRLEGGGEAHTRHLALVPPTPPFEVESDLEHARAVQHEQLDAWTWADRARRVVRVPVDVAIDRYLEQRGGK